MPKQGPVPLPVTCYRTLLTHPVIGRALVCQHIWVANIPVCKGTAHHHTSYAPLQIVIMITPAAQGAPCPKSNLTKIIVSKIFLPASCSQTRQQGAKSTSASIKLAGYDKRYTARAVCFKINPGGVYLVQSQVISAARHAAGCSTTAAARSVSHRTRS